MTVAVVLLIWLLVVLAVVAWQPSLQQWIEDGRERKRLDRFWDESEEERRRIEGTFGG